MLQGGFFAGLHQVSDARHFCRAFISVNRLRRRRGDFSAGAWIMDSGAFSELEMHKGYRWGPSEYALQIERWSQCGLLLAAVSQDYMCETYILERTGLAVREHQRRTIWRYDALCQMTRVPIMPVLQGFAPREYADHVRQYGDRLRDGAWVGAGSVRKRNAHPRSIIDVLVAIKDVRPDLRLHGFGVKLTSLAVPEIRALPWSADSMAWSYSARKQGRDGNSWIEAERFRQKVECREQQGLLF